MALVAKANDLTESGVFHTVPFTIHLGRDEAMKLVNIRYAISDITIAGTVYLGLGYTGDLSLGAADSGATFTAHGGVYAQWSGARIQTATGQAWRVMAIAFNSQMVFGQAPYFYTLGNAIVANVLGEIEYDIIKVTPREKATLVGMAGHGSPRTLRTV